jgi:Tfp pilus assembly protein FimT
MNKLGRVAMRDAAGYAVVELFVTIMIIGILASFSVSQLRGRLRSYQVTGAARLIWVDLPRGRTLAIKENRTIRVDFTSTSYTIVRVATGAVVFNRNLSSNYPGVTLGNPGSSLSFGCTGTASPASLTVQVQGASESKSFTVTATGRSGSIS